MTRLIGKCFSFPWHTVAAVILEYDSINAGERASNSLVDVQNAKIRQEARIDSALYGVVAYAVGADPSS